MSISKDSLKKLNIAIVAACFFLVIAYNSHSIQVFLLCLFVLVIVGGLLYLLAKSNQQKQENKNKKTLKVFSNESEKQKAIAQFKEVVKPHEDA